MKVTYSLSFGDVNLQHCRRTETKPKENIDSSLTPENVCLIDETKGLSIKDYTNKMMQPYIDAFNAKQKRKDRRINEKYTDYFNEDRRHKRHKSSYVQEFIVAVGNHSNLGKLWYEKHKGKDAFVSMYSSILRGIRKKYPHMHILNATIHFDEPDGTPHMHVICEYLGNGYKRGLDTQISIGRALEQDGIARLDERSKAIDDGFQQTRQTEDIKETIMAPIIKEHGLEPIKQEKSGKKHITKEEWQKIQEEIEEAEILCNRINSFLNSVQALQKPQIRVILGEKQKEYIKSFEELKEGSKEAKKPFIFGKYAKLVEQRKEIEKILEEEEEDLER